MTPLSDRKKQLETRLADLAGRIGDIGRELGEHDSKDWEEMATEREADEVLETMGVGAQQETRAIEAALQRIASGDYGTCVVCGKEIEAARLDVVPYTPFCKDHAP
ncbi:MAG: TraR/DksA C4-type zinc finger protein [Paracoccaceae bacterium]